MSQTTHHSFEGKQKQYDVAFDLTATSSAVEDSLRIRVKNTQTFVVFGELIDQKYVNGSQQLNCFAGPSDIYDHLIKNFPKMECCRCCCLQMKKESRKCCSCQENLGPNDVIVGEGTLTFLYRWGATVDRQRQVTITVPNLNLNEGQTAHLRIDQLHAEVHCTQREQSDCNAGLKATNDKNVAANEKTNDDLSATKDDLSKTNAELSKTNDSLQQTNDRLASTDQRLEQTNADLQQTNAVLSKTNEQLSKTQTDLSNTNQNVQNNTTAIEQTNKALEQTNTAFDQAKRDLQSADQKVNSNKTAIDTANVTLQQTSSTVSNLSSQTTTTKSDIQATTTQIGSTKTSIQSTGQTINQLNGRVTQLGDKETALHTQHNNLLVRVEDLENRQCNFHNELYHHFGALSKKSYYGFTEMNSNKTYGKLNRIGTHKQWQGYVNGFDIYPGNTVRYRFVNLKIDARAHMLGFCTSDLQGGSSNSESVLYGCWGRLYKNGVQIQCGTVDVGEAVDVEADRKAGFFRWKKGSQLIVETAIPEHMKNKNLYLMSFMNHLGNQIEWRALQES